MDATPTDRRAAGSTVARILPAALAGMAGAVLLAALLLAGVVPALNGARPVAVDTVGADSRWAAGALAVVRPATGAPAVGDIVAIAPGPGGVRSLAVVDSVDAAGTPVVSSADGLSRSVPVEQVEGVYLYGVPWVGGWWAVLSTPSGMFFAAALLLLLVAAHQVRAAHRRDHRSVEPGMSAL